MQLKDVLIRENFRFNKKFGQNFLTDKNLLSSIVSKAGITGEDVVVEIGCGGGTLTAALAAKAKAVIGYEIDESLRGVLAATLAGFDNVTVNFKDVMRVPTDEIERAAGGPYKLVANLPYYITTPILMKFIEEGKALGTVCVTVQEEVADRLTALPGTSDYGAITAAIDLVGSAKKIMRIDRKMFYPSPNVDSAVVLIDVVPGKYPGVDRAAYRAVVRSAFASRRKTLVNNLVQSFGISRSEAECAVAKVCGDPLARGETLSAEQFVRLSEIIGK